MRIARGELKENTKVYGRSMMSTEYGVSPETIRRSMKLLDDMKIVEVKQNSGTMILSAEKAKLYVERFGTQNDIYLMQKKLNNLLEQQETIDKQIVDVVGSIININKNFSKANPFYNHEIQIPQNSSLTDHTLAELNFWQETNATVIGIRRDDKIILSPGPYVLILGDDILIYIGDVISSQAVYDFVNK
jgi:K+/H+ antiporter YhaU regulatory subunit KhtT